MRLRLFSVGCALVLLPALLAQSPTGTVKPKWAPSPHVAATEALRPAEQRKKFHLPPGFEIQLVAADPDIRKPINIAFDAAGRLWVTETVEYPYPAPAGKGRDAVKILEDFGPDGRARKITPFAGGLNIPIGVLPLTPRQAVVYSIPSIWTMAEGGKRDVLYTGYGHADTHGMTGEFAHGFDGWIYACHGFSNTSKVRRQGARADEIRMHSGNTYRFKPDGARIEYFTHGQVNPFGLAFDPLGNLYSADCHTRPLYQLLRGAWYPSFGAPHDGLGFGPTMVNHDHGSTAIAGIAYYAADQYPPEFRDNLFVGNVVTNRINRDRLERHGSTYRGLAMPDFVRCDDPWFRPVDIKLGPDGCLYVADFYNRIIGHYEVPLDHPGRDRDKGRIWRIVYRGADGKGAPQPFPDLATSAPATLAAALNHANLTVRLQATHELVRRGGATGIAAVRAGLARGSAFQKAHGLWVLHRLGALDAPTLAACCKDAAPLVRTHAQRVLTETPRLTDDAHALVLAGLTDADAFVQRCAAEALGAHPAAANVAPLLALRHKIPADDTHLRHSVRMALRDQLRSEAVWKSLPREWKDIDRRALADVCLGVHNAPSAAFLKQTLQTSTAKGPSLLRAVHYVVRYGALEDAAWGVDLARRRRADDPAAQAELLRTIQQARQERGAPLGEAAKVFAADLTRRLLASTPPRDVQAGIDLADTLKIVGAQPQLVALAARRDLPEPQRKAAISAAAHLDVSPSIKPLVALLVSEKEALPIRTQVVHALAGTNHPGAHAALVAVLAQAPAPLQNVIALGLAGTPQGGDMLLKAVEAGKASPRLLLDRGIELRLRQARVADLARRLPALTRGLPPADQRLAELLVSRRQNFAPTRASAAKGRLVFEKSCAVCHQIAGKGAKVGPQLDGIGIRGVERLLEDLLDPNRNVDQAFRSTVLTLTNGQVLSGLVLREEGQVIVLADAQGKEVRVPKGDVQERQTINLSPMPSNFAEQIAAADFNDLVAYLLAQRVKE